MTPIGNRPVREVMTLEVTTLDENDTLSNLLGAMNAMRFRHIPVTDAGKLIGLLTERDVLALSASNLLPKSAEQDRFLKERFLIRDVMIRDVKSIGPEVPLRDAARQMLNERIGCLPVVDESNRLVGILTSSDFVALALE